MPYWSVSRYVWIEKKRRTKFFLIFVLEFRSIHEIYRNIINFITKYVFINFIEFEFWRQLFSYYLLLAVEIAGGEIIVLLVAKLGRSSLRNSLLLKFTHYSLRNCFATHCKIHLLLGCKIHVAQDTLVTRCNKHNFTHFASMTGT